MPTVSCIVCSQEFYIKPNRVTKGWGKYCSNGCAYQGQRKGSMLSCSTCGKDTYKTATDQRRSKSGKYFCNKSCQTIWRNSKIFTGENHGNWTGGESSYRDTLRRASVSRVCSKCKNDDVRILAVHHKDRNRKNNALSNLIWLCHNCHFLVHHYKLEAEGFVVA